MWQCLPRVYVACNILNKIAHKETALWRQPQKVMDSYLTNSDLISEFWLLCPFELDLHQLVVLS